MVGSLVECVVDGRQRDLYHWLVQSWKEIPNLVHSSVVFGLAFCSIPNIKYFVLQKHTVYRSFRQYPLLIELLQMLFQMLLPISKKVSKLGLYRGLDPDESPLTQFSGTAHSGHFLGIHCIGHITINQSNSNLEHKLF